MNKLDRLAMKMMEYDAGSPGRIQHFIKVHGLARLIGLEENMPEQELYVLEAAAYTHDIGIKKAQALYGRSSGALQEQLGPDVAREMLAELGFAQAETERICYLIAHHHTYDNIDGLDYQILVEADFLVNLYEGKAGEDKVRETYHNIFRTQAGRALCRLMFGIA